LGTRKNLVKFLGITRQRLNGWLNDYKSMGYEYAIAIEHLTCGKIKAEDLLPQKAMILKNLGLTATFTSTQSSSPNKSFYSMEN